MSLLNHFPSNSLFTPNPEAKMKLIPKNKIKKEPLSPPRNSPAKVNKLKIIPKPKSSRMASLNAMAMVHVMMESSRNSSKKSSQAPKKKIVPVESVDSKAKVLKQIKAMSKVKKIAKTNIKQKDKVKEGKLKKIYKKMPLNNNNVNNNNTYDEKNDPILANMKQEVKEKKAPVKKTPKVLNNDMICPIGSKRMASINAKAILALNAHKEKKPIIKTKNVFPKISAKIIKKKPGGQVGRPPLSKKRKLVKDKEDSSAPFPKKRAYRKKSEVSTEEVTKSTQSCCYPCFQSPVHISTSPIIIHSYDYNPHSTILPSDNYSMGLVDNPMPISSFGSCCHGCPIGESMLHSVHEVSLICKPSHSCHHIHNCSPCSHTCHCRPQSNFPYHSPAHSMSNSVPTVKIESPEEIFRSEASSNECAFNAPIAPSQTMTSNRTEPKEPDSSSSSEVMWLGQNMNHEQLNKVIRKYKKKSSSHEDCLNSKVISKKTPNKPHLGKKDSQSIVLNSLGTKCISSKAVDDQPLSGVKDLKCLPKKQKNASKQQHHQQHHLFASKKIHHKETSICSSKPSGLMNEVVYEDESIYKPSKANGWHWSGKPYKKLVYLSNDDIPLVRTCYPAIQHYEGDIIKERDSVLLRSGPKKSDIPYIAKIVAFFENDAGEMTMSLLWYYRPEHTGETVYSDNEIFASKHKDTNGVGCIEDRCYVLTFSEYCRYRSTLKRLEYGVPQKPDVAPPLKEGYPRRDRIPRETVVTPELVFFCYRGYDYRHKKMLKNRSC